MVTKILQLLLLISFTFSPLATFAAGLTMSVTPTIFEMSAAPAQNWESAVRVINGNRQELTVYAEVVNFEPRGETGHGQFLPVFEEFTEGKTLAEWITVPDGPITIAPEDTASIPVQVQIPADAAPGGHYAAVMIKTNPPEDSGSFQIGTSQAVTSLFLVRIAGSVIENGDVRTFRVTDKVAAAPEAEFEVRFENKGNVHLQPQGEIVIYNMWGKERGVVPINHQTHFGNVLPESVRKFNFTWTGEQTFTDIGRYKAELTLAYGKEARKFVTQGTYFWVIPFKQVFTLLAALAFSLWFATWIIRAYVRRMLSLAGLETGRYVPPSQRMRAQDRGDVVVGRKLATAPIEEGVRDFRSRLEGTKAFGDTLKVLGGFVRQYWVFFAGLIGVVMIVTLVWQFFAQVTTEQRDYEVTIEVPGVEKVISSEDILYDRNGDEAQVAQKSATIDEEVIQNYELVLTNSGDTPGAAGALRSELEAEGYVVTALRSDFGETKERSVILYDVEVQDAALELSKKLDGALLSAKPAVASSTDELSITVLIGNDYVFEQ